MRVFRKLGAYILIVLVAAVAATAFGAVHDQLSYTVAPEYFTRFKFVQFAWARVAFMPPRVGAAVVGGLATWWVGLYAGMILGAIALRRPLASEMLRETTDAFVVAALVAIGCGVLGLVVGWLGFDPAKDYIDWWRPAGLTAPRRFFAAGMMHNGSYLGGVIGVLVAGTRIWRRAARDARALQAHASFPPAGN
jgi:hypothetical protein